MFQGNWKCSECGGAITELPFEPRSTEGLKCRDCHHKGRGNSAPRQSANGERKMFDGDWACANCGAKISQLPFEPRSTDNLKCIDCFKQARA